MFALALRPLSWMEWAPHLFPRLSVLWPSAPAAVPHLSAALRQLVRSRSHGHNRSVRNWDSAACSSDHATETVTSTSIRDLEKNQGTSNRHELRATMPGADAPPVESGAHAKESAAYECTCPDAGRSAAKSLVPCAFCNALALVCGAHARLLLLLRQLQICSLPSASPSPRPAITISTAISCASATDHPKRERANGDGRGLQLPIQVSWTTTRTECNSLWSAVDVTYRSCTGDCRVANQSSRYLSEGKELVRGECSRETVQKL